MLMLALLWALPVSAQDAQVGDKVMIALVDGSTVTGLLMGKLSQGYLVREEGAYDNRLIAYEWVKMLMVDSDEDESSDDEEDAASLLAPPVENSASWGAGTGALQLKAHPTYFVIIDPRTADRFPINSDGEILVTAPRQILGRNYKSFTIYDNLGGKYRNDEFWKTVKGEAWYENILTRPRKLKIVSGVLLGVGLPVMGAGLAVTAVSLITALMNDTGNYNGAFTGMGILAISIPLFVIRAPIKKEIDLAESMLYDPDEIYRAAYTYAEMWSGGTAEGFPGLDSSRSDH